MNHEIDLSSNILNRILSDIRVIKEFDSFTGEGHGNVGLRIKNCNLRGSSDTMYNRVGDIK